MDAAEISAAVVPYITAATVAYGHAVLTRVEDAAAVSTVGVGQRIIQRIMRRERNQADVATAVSDLAEDPDDPDLQATLRVQIKKALKDDPDLKRELQELVSGAGDSIQSIGERSIAAKSIDGIANTGNDVTINR
ncbi:hypothetical protein GQF42_15525 [Streptomyces broussonetiae]|uniref:Uncharacterized protein n=1 Tax=Streptomyces broussonetiae TaxID=2686304 RepID=A0A6I6MUY8_9ACTN|nr:hypothetical protein [Streptomyces broussonetiae]QHA04508.1 hypothetical protein GQF42_15525 [Streptomyces broussonetiae]